MDKHYATMATSAADAAVRGAGTWRQERWGATNGHVNHAHNGETTDEMGDVGTQAELLRAFLGTVRGQAALAVWTLLAQERAANEPSNGNGHVHVNGNENGHIAPEAVEKHLAEIMAKWAEKHL